MPLYRVGSAQYAIQYIGREWSQGIIDVAGYVANFGSGYNPQFGPLPDTVTLAALPPEFGMLVFVGGDPTDTVWPDNALHGHLADASAITTETTITPFEATHGHTAESPVLTVVFIVPNDALHAHTADASGIIPVISPADSLHAQRTDASAVTITALIVPRECLHRTYADATAALGGVGGDADTAMVKPDVVLRLVAPYVISFLLDSDHMIGNVP